MLDRLKTRLVPGAREWWKWSSVQFAVLGGAVTTWATTDPKSFAQIVALLPAPARPFVGLGLTALAIGLRVTKRKED